MKATPRTKKPHTLILGGTRGIGHTIASTLVDEGHAVTVVGRRAPHAANSRAVKYCGVDLTDDKRRTRVLERIVTERGRLRNVIFAQRFRGPGDEWVGEIETSLSATRAIIEQLVPKFARDTDNSIVIVSSIASLLIASEQPVGYHVAKAGLAQMARYYAVALAREGIRVNCVSPGIVLKDEARSFYREQKKLAELYHQIIPRGRMITASEVAALVAFLCSVKALAVTGQDIIADGGVSLQWQESLARDAVLENLKVTREAKR